MVDFAQNMLLVYSFMLGIPCILVLGQRLLKIHPTMAVMKLVCLYGYSLVSFLPATILCRVIFYFNNNPAIAGLVLLFPTVHSATFIYQNAADSMCPASNTHWKRWFLLLMLLFHVIFFWVFLHDFLGTFRGGFDFYVLAMSYQPEFCSSTTYCFNPKEGFTIHGLWPEWYNGTWPSSCSNQKLDERIIKQVGVKRLDRYWPNAKVVPGNSGYTGFWEHEWSKHGTCTGLSPRVYMDVTLDNYLPTPRDVQGSFGRTISKEKLLQAYGGSDMVATICNGNYLSEVRVCLGKSYAGFPTRQVECPSFILEQDNCYSSALVLWLGYENGKKV